MRIDKPEDIRELLEIRVADLDAMVQSKNKRLDELNELIIVMQADWDDAAAEVSGAETHIMNLNARIDELEKGED